VNHHPLGVRPRVEELRDLTRVVLAEKYVSRLAALGHVVKVESQHGREARRNPGRRSIGVRDRNADLLAARLISLGLLA
jgi:hypothetical protein